MPLEVLDDVAVDGMTRRQRRLARRTAYRLATAPKRKAHRDNLIEMRKAERRAVRNGRLRQPYPGRRGGRRVRLVWADQSTFETWRNRYKGLPRTRRKRFTLTIGSPAYEFPGDDQTPASGRAYTEVQLDEREQHWMQANNVTVCEAGTFNELTDDEEELI